MSNNIQVNIEEEDIFVIRTNNELQEKLNINENIFMIIFKLSLYSFIIVIIVISYNNNNKINYIIKYYITKNESIKDNIKNNDAIKADKIEKYSIKPNNIEADSKKNISKIEIRSPPKTSYTLEDYKEYYKMAKEGKILYPENLVYSETPIISVIIPLYNAEKYINATLKSVQNQRMKDIEIILVDDCSKDKSLSYVEEAKKEDPRITITRNK